jgi:hypothetical protein
MNREHFQQFVADTIEDVLRLAEERGGKHLPRSVVFKWIGSKEEPIRDGIVDEIMRRVFVDEDHIRPCVDIGVGDLLDDGTPVIMANVAWYPPGPFQKNWTGRDGPFVRIIGGPFLTKIAGKPYEYKGGSFGFVIPDMYS